MHKILGWCAGADTDECLHNHCGPVVAFDLKVAPLMVRGNDGSVRRSERFFTVGKLDDRTGHCKP